MRTDLDHALRARAEQKLGQAIKLLREAQTSLPPGAPTTRLVSQALDDAYAVWRQLAARREQTVHE